MSDTQAPTILLIDISRIIPSPAQTRAFTQKPDAELRSLAANIEQVGLINPVTVRGNGKQGRYELVAGERRLRAFKLLGRNAIPAIVQRLDDRQAHEMTAVENLHREDLNPLETARAYRLLAEHFDRTQDEIARAVGKDRSTVSNTLRLLDLPLSVQNLLSDGRLTPGHARAQTL